MAGIERTESERNFEAFQTMLPMLLQRFPGKFALLHAEKVDEYFDSPAAAVLEGARRYGQGSYSVQEVTDELESLGFYSYAGGALQA